MNTAVSAGPGSTPPPAATVRKPTDQVLIEVALDQVHPDPGNPRSSVGDVSELAASIDAVGLLQPIVCRRVGAKLLLVAGERRLAAHKLLGRRMIPVLVRREMLPDEALAGMLVENGQRKDLDPIEEARALARLKKDSGGTDSSVAARIGRTQVYVSGRLALLSLPPAEQELVRVRQLNLTDAVRLGREQAGTARERRPGSIAYFSDEHDLAKQVRARCKRLGHKSRGAKSVGGTGCGECWESVIRGDERNHLEHLAAAGKCVVCRPRRGAVLPASTAQVAS